MQNRPIGIGLFGFGVVGTAVYQILVENQEQLARYVGAPLAVRHIVVRHPEKPRPVAVPPGLISADPARILHDPAVDVVVEVMGGLEPAREYVLGALAAGKAVVTANKELVADHSQELLAAAAQAGVDLFFEASVGGGIPILRPLRETLAAAGRIERVLGIVNGTTNYILTEMTRSGKTFAEALAEAQAAGYAEPDPTADVEGHDAARKVAILASLAFHTHVKSGDVIAEGITRISPEDIQYGTGRGWVLKLVALAARHGDAIEARVHPAFLPAAHPLAGVHDAFNAIYVHGREVGETLFYGRGAGGLPTASAVVGDILAAALHRRLGTATSRPWAAHGYRVLPAGEGVYRFYLRLGPAGAGEAAAAAPLWLRAAGGGRAVAVATPPAEAVAALAAAGVPVERTAPLGGERLAVETGPVAEADLAVAVARAGAVVENAIRILS